MNYRQFGQSTPRRQYDKSLLALGRPQYRPWPNYPSPFSPPTLKKSRLTYGVKLGRRVLETVVHSSVAAQAGAEVKGVEEKDEEDNPVEASLVFRAR